VDEILGNSTNVNIIKKGLDKGTLSHTLLFTGDPGCGKTTAARIIALGLNCKKSDHTTSDPCLECDSCESILNYSSLDVIEINVAQTGGKDYVNKIIEDLPSAAFSSRFKVIIFDEAHELTTAAKKLLLKTMENGFHHVFFIFCTNHPEKLVINRDTTFLDRCYTMNFNHITKKLILDLLMNVAEFEGMAYTNEVINYIAEDAKGVPRVALNRLEQVNDEGSWSLDVAKEIILSCSDTDDPNVIEIAKAIVKGSFKSAFKIYDEVKDNKQPESIRITIMSYLVGCLKRAKDYSSGDKFSAAIDVISQPIYESGKAGDYKLYNYLYKAAKIIRGK
jgi:DNA polymerase-3 subunit gamma/tau